MTNGIFTDIGTGQTSKISDDDGYVTVEVEASGTQNIIVTCSHDGINKSREITLLHPMLSIWSSPRLDDPSGSAVVYARLTVDNTPMVGETITFTALAAGTLNQTTAVTNNDGIAQVTFTASGTGSPKVRAYYENDCGEAKTAELGIQVDIVFCVDCSDTMWVGIDHTAGASIQRFLNELTSAGVQFRAGGVLFTEMQQPLLFRSLSAYSGMAGFCSWVEQNDLRWGSDENPLTAMKKAVDDIQANSPSDARRFIVLVTDEYYTPGYQSIGRQELVDLLHETTDVLGGVYISVWENQDLHIIQYQYGEAPSLAVNGGFDSVQFLETARALQYPFDRLSSRVLAGLW